MSERSSAIIIAYLVITEIALVVGGCLAGIFRVVRDHRSYRRSGLDRNEWASSTFRTMWETQLLNREAAERIVAGQPPPAYAAQTPSRDPYTAEIEISGIKLGPKVHVSVEQLAESEITGMWP